jgi:hypothetical protein
MHEYKYKHIVKTFQSRTHQCKLGRFHPFIGHEGPYGEYRYSCSVFLTSAIEGGEGSASSPSRTLPPGKTRYPLYRRLVGPQGRCWHVRKMSSPPGFDPRTVQHVGSRYTDYATRPTSINYLGSNHLIYCTVEGNYNTLVL